MYNLCFISHEVESDDLLRPLQTLAVLCFYVFSFATVKGQGLLVLAQTRLLSYTQSSKKKRQMHNRTVHIFISESGSDLPFVLIFHGSMFSLVQMIKFLCEAWKGLECQVVPYAFPTVLLSWSSVASLKCVTVK